MQVLVQPLHHITEGVHVGDPGLLTQEGGEAFQVAQVLGLGNTTGPGGRHREFDRVHAKMLQRLVGIVTELDIGAEVIDPLVIQLQRGYKHDKRQRKHAGQQQQALAVANDKIRKPFHRRLPISRFLNRLETHRQNTQQRRQQDERKQPGSDDADGGHVAQVPERR